MKKTIKVLATIFALSSSIMGYGGELKVIFPPGKPDDMRSKYFKDALDLALKKSGVAFKVEDYPSVIDAQPRKIDMVKENKLSVIWDAGGSGLKPIKIPLLGGYIGKRIFIINKKSDVEERLAKVNTVEDLKKNFTIGSGTGWAGTTILKDNGFKVTEAAYDGLFQMIHGKRIDLYSRSVLEAFIEIDARAKDLPDLGVDTKVGLRYPKVVFFFVNESATDLYKAISSGLEKAFEDGSFVKLFREHPMTHGSIDRAKLKDRKWFDLPPARKEDAEDIAVIQKYLDKFEN